MSIESLSDSLAREVAGLERVMPIFTQFNSKLPMCVYSVLSENNFDVLEGNAHVYEALVKFDVYGLTLESAVSQTQLIYDELIGYRGTISSHEVFNIRLVDSSMFYAEDMEVFVKETTLKILYSNN